MLRIPLRMFLHVAVLMLGVASASAATEPLHMIVMDPLSAPLACACVPGTGQRDYKLLATRLETELKRPIQVTFDESLKLAMERTGGKADIIIGKDSMVRFDATKAGVQIRELAALSDKQGRTTLHGAFLVKTSSPIQSLSQLAGKTVALGPVEDVETHEAAKLALANARVNFRISGSIDSAALAMSDGEVDAAVVSDFLPPLLEGCGKLEKGSTRVLGTTGEVPFIHVFAATTLGEPQLKTMTEALRKVSSDAKLLAALESKEGFKSVAAPTATDVGWTDWRGPGRTGVALQIPSKLPASLPLIWRAPLTGPAMAGLAATSRFVIVPDKSADFKRDAFRCLSASDGKVVWQLEYDAADDVEYSNAPRATPVIHDGLVYLQGALGHLHCAELATGKVVWKLNLYADLHAEKLNWGTSVPPLVVDDKLIVAPGAKDGSVVALNRKTGAVLWKSPGHAAAYSAFIHATFDGVPQIIGYDVASLGGWDAKTGKRLWELVPPDGADFNVTTPVVLGNNLLLAAENNATRLHAFDGKGKLVSTPAMKNKDLAPDTCTPAVANGRIFATAYGELFCLDAATLKTIWRKADDLFQDHSNIVAGKDRVLIWTMSGDLMLIDATSDDYKPLSHLRPLKEKHPDTMAHPAFVGDRIYLRGREELLCLKLAGD